MSTLSTEEKQTLIKTLKTESTRRGWFILAIIFAGIIFSLTRELLHYHDILEKQQTWILMVVLKVAVAASIFWIYRSIAPINKRIDELENEDANNSH